MSFILDALRKSESERQQDVGPSITRIPDAIAPRGVPTWAVATIAALGAGVVVLAGAWLTSIVGSDARTASVAPSSDSGQNYDGRGPDLTSRAMDAPASSSESLLPQRRVEPLALPPARPSSVAAARTESAPSISSLAAAAGTSRSSLREAASNPVPVQSARPAADGSSMPAADSMPPSYHAAASSLGLPALRLELLAFGATPVERFVFINGSRYQEGDTLSEGPRVVAINERGAVLLAAGRQLQLDQN